MEMVNMKMKREEPNEKETMLGQSDYPYGLCIHLDNETLDKLGISELPEVGKEINLSAVGYVKSASMSDSEEGGKMKSLGIQITDLGLGKMGKKSEKKEEAAKVLYKGGPDSGVRVAKGTTPAMGF